MQFLKNKLKEKNRKYLSRKKKTNEVIKSTNPDYRIVVNKSNKFIIWQVVDLNWNVVANISDKSLKWATKSDRAKLAGIELWKVLLEKKIEKVAFDRNGFLYHWRVAAFADGLRESWLNM